MVGVAALVLYLVPLSALAGELKIATWNLDWLTTRPASASSLPPDVRMRGSDDIALLARYAQRLNADVVALQEVDNIQAAGQLFPRDRYAIHMTRDHVLQRVGIAVRRGLSFDINPDLTGLADHHLRSGADITLHLGSRRLRLLAVHLKKGCRNDQLRQPHGTACLELAEQIAPLQQWIRDRLAAGEAFVILGDFNRWMDGRDAFLKQLRDVAPLARATEGYSSPCWGSENFIDHILTGGPAADWMQKNTLKVLTYSETDTAWKDRLSDHCPVSVLFQVPD
jgi:endonuclease/exonuclease/phosphatase family metal-dependent hydrolase